MPLADAMAHVLLTLLHTSMIWKLVRFLAFRNELYQFLKDQLEQHCQCSDRNQKHHLLALEVVPGIVWTQIVHIQSRSPFTFLFSWLPLAILGESRKFNSLLVLCRRVRVLDRLDLILFVMSQPNRRFLLGSEIRTRFLSKSDVRI